MVIDGTKFEIFQTYGEVKQGSIAHAVQHVMDEIRR
jgi:hypothetical protein